MLLHALSAWMFAWVRISRIRLGSTDAFARKGGAESSPTLDGVRERKAICSQILPQARLPKWLETSVQRSHWRPQPTVRKSSADLPESCLWTSNYSQRSTVLPNQQELLGSWGDKRHCLSEMHNLELGIQSKTEKEQDASNLLLFLPVNLVLKIFAWGRRKKGRFRGCQLKNSNQIHTCIRRQINCFDAAPRLSLQFTGEDKANRLSH